MSYDLRFAVKEESGQFVDFCKPELAHPTYNLGTMFRKAMDWDFNAGEYYCVSDALYKICKGYTRLINRKNDYRKYEPDNGWGTVEDATEVLNSLLEKISEIYDECHIPLNNIYIAW